MGSINPQDIPVALNTRSIKTTELNCMRFNISETEERFGNEVLSCANKTLSYENPQLRRVAKSCIPMEEINRKVEARLQLVKSNRDSYLKDFLILELLDWFKTSFFRWVDVPKCTFCTKPMKSIGYGAPSVEDLQFDANKVELYICSICNSGKRFPRYNHPGKLLVTREGRCGEWANCFALLCRSLDYETRFVNDWNDHVWVEIYSDTQQRWMHCDPCENVCDKPLVYEQGWGKKYSYVIAFSKDEIQDVTWRYTRKFDEVISRRKLCRESWLINLIDNVSTLLQRYLTADRKKVILDRKLVELISFLSPNNAPSEDYGGRTSGSIEWRLARGEIATTKPKSDPFVFYPTKVEQSCKEIHVSYTPVTDKYLRISDPTDEKVNSAIGWQNCAFRYNNISRKVERDWKMAYLARTESSSSDTVDPTLVKGTVSWKFDTGESDLVLDRLSFICQSATFENGIVQWRLSDGVKRVSYPSGSNMLNIPDFCGSKSVELTAELSCGIGQNAWQHAQLFRVALESSADPFIAKIRLKNKVT